MALFTVFKHMSKGHCFANKSFQFLNCMPEITLSTFECYSNLGTMQASLEIAHVTGKHGYKGISRPK